MSDEERDDSIEETKPEPAPAANAKPLPVKWILIALGGIFIIELIVGVVLYLTKGPASGDAHASPSPSVSPGAHASSAPESTAHQSTGHSGGGHPDAAGEGHNQGEHAAVDGSALVQGHQEQSMSSGSPVPEESAMPEGSAVPAVVVITPSPTPVIRLDNVQFPSLTIPPDGEIRVDLKDAGKLLDILLAE